MTIAFVLLGFAIIIATIRAGLHVINEGHVGVYYRGGALLSGTNRPGYHVMIPFLDRCEQVQITMQTDAVQNIPCGTSGGVMLHFDRIEVVNRLNENAVHAVVKNYTVNYDKFWIFDKVNHEVNQFCSKHSLKEILIEKFHQVDEMLMEALQDSVDVYAPGIEVVSVRVTKPHVPREIMANFEAMEAEKSKLLVAEQRQIVVAKEAETAQLRNRVEAESRAEVSKIQQQQLQLERESQRLQAAIADAELVAREKAMADAAFYSAQRKAEADALLLSDNYLKLQTIRAITNNTKIYFGDSPASMITEMLAKLGL